jgi:histidinol phosphatase-like PHP family hydrolase
VQSSNSDEEEKEQCGKVETPAEAAKREKQLKEKLIFQEVEKRLPELLR